MRHGHHVAKSKRWQQQIIVWHRMVQVLEYLFDTLVVTTIDEAAVLMMKRRDLPYHGSYIGLRAFSLTHNTKKYRFIFLSNR